MPFYEYECSACKFYVEALQKISDAPMKKCPSCKKPTMKRLMSAPAFRLKGDGWYETDFKSDQDKKRNLAGDDKDTSSSDTKSDTTSTDKSTDAKPVADTKSESKAESKKSEGKSEKSSRGKSSASANSKKPAAKAKPKSKVKPAAKKK
jgi:putative FmdB family regulatory protein